jgi:hypothetical protein
MSTPGPCSCTALAYVPSARKAPTWKQIQHIPFGVFGGILLIAVLMLGVAVTPTGATVRKAAAGRSCDDIFSQHAFYSVTVSRGSVSCETGRRVLGKFMGGGGVKHGGQYAYQQWWSIGDWRCGFGAGAGGCSRAASKRDPSASIIAQWLAWECGYKPSGATVPCADTPRDALRAVAAAKLQVVPLWPTYLPARVKHGTWSVSDLRGRQSDPSYPDRTASGPEAFRVDYGYPVDPGSFGGGEFSRTSSRAFKAALQASRINGPPRYLRLGGRDVVQFRLGSTATEWAFSGPGGYYVFASKDFGGPSLHTIGRMIGSLHSINQLTR